MFQLFRRGSPSLDSYLPLSLRNLNENSRLVLSEKTCLLCKCLNISSRLQIRDQSSVTNPSLNKTRKKFKKKLLKSYTDIIVVNEESSHFKRANVTKLTPSDLNLLATTNISLNELYKIKHVNKSVLKVLPHTYSNLAVEGNEREFTPLSVAHVKSDIRTKVENNICLTEIANDIDNYKIEAAEESETVIHEADLEGLSVRDSLQPEVIEEVPDNVIQDVYDNVIQEVSHNVAQEVSVNVVQEDCNPEKQQVNVEKPNVLLNHRDMVASKTLAAYIEVCNHSRNPQRGLYALTYHQSRSRRDPQYRISSMKNLNVYYTLLKGFANKGDYAKLEEVLDIMKTENIEPDLNCYIAIFECLGRINVQNQYLKDIRIYVKEASGKGITFDQMMNNGIFLKDERQQVLKALLAYNNEYIPKYDKPILWYNNHLVNHLNVDRTISFELSKSSGTGGLIKPNKMNELLQKQVVMEEKGYVTIKSIERKDPPTKEISHFRNALNNHYKMWAESASSAFYRDLAALTAKRNIFNLEPYLRSVPSKDIVEIIVQEATKIAQGSETYSPEVAVLYKMLGAKVYARYRILRKQKTGVLEKTLMIHSKYSQNYAACHNKLNAIPDGDVHTNPRIEWQLLEHQLCDSGATLKMGHQPWVPVTLTAIGKFLYHIIMHDLKVDVNSMRPSSKHKNFLPAFYTIFRSQGRLVKEEVKPHPVLSRLYRCSEPETLTFPTSEVPMLCPPVPWTSVENGGYIISPTDFVRLPSHASSQKKRVAETDPVQMYPNFDALNQLSAVPWKVNTKILDVILEVFRNGGSSKLDVPESPSSLPSPPPVTSDMDKAEKYKLFKQKLQHRRKKAEMYSLWCDCLYRLSLANHFRNDVFWLPHNMDFRGRVYPVPPHLNHLGSDLARSMLVFAEARPLGPNGLDWLKIHLINLTGLKKRDSIKDRLQYANDNIHLILDSADHPLTGQKWWVESDEPWQTLACCIEIADVIRSGIDPAEYKSHFPIHQDGSCNGLQHYAALGRDSAGAFSVNLAPCDVPQDVYSAVVALVEDQRAKDESDGLEIAKILNGFVKRKVIKQTIMTTVYGVTRFGARLQIAKQLKDIDDFPKDAVWAASSYLTSRTFESLRTMFTSTREIQDWFTECARLISGVGGSLVEWVTPLGLPVVQPYIKYKKIFMPSGYESFVMDQFEKPNVMKQKNAFPPNFIHSLDSSHMMLTSLHCERAGITFVSVHDCYWTHPSTIHIMNKICREQFVALHSEPILENLSVFLYDLFAYDEGNLNGDGTVTELSRKKLNRVLKKLPKTGDFDIKNVLNSIYFFS